MNQFFMASWSSAVRHNYFWDTKLPESQKKNFITKVKNIVIEIIESYKTMPQISSALHQKNIDKLKELKPGTGTKLGIGKAQKILNLMCKYCWCMGWIPESPHLVIDSQIISHCPREDLKKIKWTKMTDSQYINLIEAFNNNFSSLAEWELANWQSSLDGAEG